MAAVMQGAQGLMGYAPQQVSTAQHVSNDQIQHYMDPYLDSVVGANLNDINHQRQVAQNQTNFNPAFGGGSRDEPLLLHARHHLR